MTLDRKNSHPIHRFIRDLTLLWIVTVTIYALLALSSYLLLSTALSAHDGDTTKVNALGMQRTYSQTISFDSMRLVSPNDAAQREAIRASLRSDIDNMRAGYEELLANDDIMGELESFFADDARDLNSRLTIYLLQAEQLASAPDDNLSYENPALMYIEANADVLLTDLNAQVTYYQANSVDNLGGLQRINIVRLSFILGLLVIQTLFIFTPVRKNLLAKASELITEIRERERIQHTLEDKQHFIDQVTEAIPDIVYVYDLKSGHNVFFNRGISEALGYSREQALAMSGKTMESLVHPEDRARQLQDAARYASYADGEIAENEYRFKHADGTYRLMQLRSTIFRRDAAGNVAQILGIMQDITEQRFLYDQTLSLQVGNKLEQERARLLSEFITHTSHDIRTPLSIINTSMYMLKRHTDPERQQHYITEITNSITRLTHIIDQMHQMAQLEHIDHLATQKINLAHLWKEIEGHKQASIEEKQLKVTCSAETEVTISADRQWITRAIEGVLENAIRYAPENGQIDVKIWQADTRVHLRIHNDGDAIDAEALPMIFNRFYKVDAARKEDGSGAGMGLPIAKRIIEIYGGTIDVESAPDEGVAFIIALPYEREMHLMS